MLARKFLRWHECSRSGREKYMLPQAVYIWELFSMQNVQPNPNPAGYSGWALVPSMCISSIQIGYLALSQASQACEASFEG